MSLVQLTLRRVKVAELASRKRAANEAGEDASSASPKASSHGSVKRPRGLSQCKLYVGNLPPTCDENKLQKYFGVFGAIAEAIVIRHESGHSRGFGFVTFEEKEVGEGCAR